MWARFTVLNETPIASAIAGCVIPLSRSNTIWMRSRCAAGIFHRSAVFSSRLCFLVHLTIRPPESDSQSESYPAPSRDPEKRQKSLDSNSYGSGISRAQVGLAHRTVRYQSAVTPRSSSARVGLMMPPLSLFGCYPVTKSLDLKILRRRFSAVAYDLELDLLAFVERGQTCLLHRRNVHKHIAPAALRLDESIASGRIKPLYSSGRHQSSPRGKRGGPSNLHILATAAIR